MSVLSTIARTEARLLRADGVAVLATVLFLAAIAYAGWSGTRHAEAQRATASAFADEHAETLAEFREMAATAEAEARANALPADSITASVQRPYVLGTVWGQVATLDPGPLAAFAVGQGDLSPHAVRASARGVEALGADTPVESPLRLLVGPVDLAFVFLVLFPLLALALGVGLTTAERESGLLRLILARPVRLSTLAAGKMLVRGGLLLACAVVGTGAVWLAAGGPGGVGRWALWVLVAALYGAFWLALAAFVDSRVRRPATAAVVLAACWLGLAVVVPASLAVAAETVFPVPSRMEYVAAQRQAASEASRESEAALAQYLGDHPELVAPADEADFYMLSVARDDRVADALAPIDARFDQRREQQRRLVNTLGYLSPTVLAQRAFLDVAGTGPARHQAFADQAEAFSEAWADRFVPAYFTGAPLRATDYDAAPTFTFREPSTGDLLARLVGPLVALGLLAGALAISAARGYGRPESAP